MNAHWLSRIRLRRDAPVAALARLLVPDETQARVAAAHHLVWAAFSDGPDRQRDFLWREEAPGRFLALSSRRPVDGTGLFAIETRPFMPDLAAGDRLGFLLRANAVVSRSTGPGIRGRRHDVVMDALRQLPAGATRAEERPGVVMTAGRNWLTAQGDRHGFRLADGLSVDGYERQKVARPGASPMLIGILEFEGLLVVDDPARFVPALVAGFGKARAFGCGLMLIRRA